MALTPELYPSMLCEALATAQPPPLGSAGGLGMGGRGREKVQADQTNWVPPDEM